MENRIKYLDGLKLCLCYWVMLLHCYLAYIPNGYIGYGSNYAEADKASVFIENMPFSFFINTATELYLFFAIIALVTTVAFYRSKEPLLSLKKQAFKRYFRFMLPVAAAILLTYGLNRANLMHFDDIYLISNSSWNLAEKPIDVSFWEALYIAFIKCFFVNDTAILVSLWCMDTIFIGSMLTYGFLAVVGNSKKRYAVYIIFTLLCIPFPKYFVFLIGIVCGDFLTHGLKNIYLPKIKRECLAFFLMLSGFVIGAIPSFFVAPPITLKHTWSISAGLILTGIMLSDFTQKIFSAKVLVSQSKYSFSILLVHIPILYCFSNFIFKAIYAATGQYLVSFLLMFFVYAAISHVAAIGFHYMFEVPSAKLADFVFNKVSHCTFFNHLK